MSSPITPSSAARPDSIRRTWLAVVILAGAAFAVYYNSLQVPFLFDDRAAILENPTIRQFSTALTPINDGRGVSGRPLVNASLALNYAIGGTNVTGYHLVNIALHLGSALLLFGIVRRTLFRPIIPDRFRAAAFPLALFIALLWIVHPLQTETVTCVIQRTEGLVSFFYLLTLYCYLRGAESLWRSARWYAGAVVSCFAGVASKEVMVTAPLVILFFDRTFLAGTFRTAWQARRPLYLGLASSWLLLAILMTASSGRGGTVGFGVGVAPWDYLLTQCQAIATYLQLSFWPKPLVVDYGTVLAHGVGDVWLAGLGVVALLIATGLALRRHPLLGFLGAWFFLILAPSSSFVPLASQTIAEHRMYLPLAALIVLAIVGLHAWLGKFTWLAGGIVAGGLGLLTVQRNRVYQDELGLWTDTVAHAPNNVRARTNLGNALFHAGRLPEAIAELEQALNQNPLAPAIHINLAGAYCQIGQPAKGIPHGLAAIRLEPKDPDAYINLANAFMGTGQPAEAVKHLETALRLQPNAADIHLNLAVALKQLGQTHAAIPHYEAAFRAQLATAPTLFDYGNALAREERYDDAIAAYRRTLQAQPNHVGALANLGNALLATGHTAEAITAYEAALRLDPADQRLRENLAVARSAPGGG